MADIGAGGLRLLLSRESYSIHRLAPDAPVDLAGLRRTGWFSLTRSEAELSLVAPAGVDPGPGACEPGWSRLRVAGTLDFGLVGIIAELARRLADAGVSIFTVSTYDTDYVLLKTADIPTAIRALVDGGHTVSDDPNP